MNFNSPLINKNPKIQNKSQIMKECQFYTLLDDKTKKVECTLCPHNCKIENKKSGFCGVRINQNGKLMSINYSKTTGISVDPIEKKPLYHYYPGKGVISIGTFGCNLKCMHCQNFAIANIRIGEYQEMEFFPDMVVMLAKEKGFDMIAYTYNEPTVFYEYAYETMKLAKESNPKTKNIWVTNGYINEKPLKKLIEENLLDAINVDLKFFKNSSYITISQGTLEPVLNTIKLLHKNKDKVHLELTTLIIPDINDSEEEITEMCEWIKNNLDENVPIHFSKFSPMYKMDNKKSTPIETLIKAKEIAKKTGLKYVYIGNVYGEEFSSTYCPKCNAKLIERDGYEVKKYIKGNKCICGEEIPGVLNDN